jgi:hypothetical protein
MTRERALQLQVIRGVLMHVLTIDQGANRLGMPSAELQRLVIGARRAVIDALGEAALEAARRVDEAAACDAR